MNVNGSLSILNYGTFKVKVAGLDYGIEIVADEDIGRRHKAFYPKQTISSDFSIDLKFSTESARTKFSTWLMNYAKLLIQPGSTVGAIVVSVPGRSFLSSGVPISAIPFEIHVNQIAPAVHLEFQGTKDWLTVKEKQAYSKFNPFSKLALAFNPQIQYFYPAGTQLAGSNYGSDYLYDQPPDPVDIQRQVREEQGGVI